MRCRIGVVAGVGAVVAAALAGCGSASETAPPPSGAGAAVTTARVPTSAPEARPPYAIAHRTETFVDRSRPTDDPSGSRDAPHRTLVTSLTFPEARGPFPLVVLAHGLDGHPRKFTGLMDAWARAGYVVAAPAFPLTNDEIEGEHVIADYVQQPGDVSFVIDSILGSERRWADRVDSERIGVAGLSLGGGTVYGVAFNSCCRDERIDAALVMSGLQFPFDGEDDVSGMPVMIMHGTEDTSLPYERAAAAYRGAAPPKFLVTLTGGRHSEPYEDAPSPHDRVVARVTVDFWNLTLAGDAGARPRLLRDGNVPGVATVDAA